MQFRRDHLDFAGGEISIRLLPLNDLAFDSDHKLAANLLGLRVRGRLRFLIENDLHNTRAVAQVQEEQVAEIAAPMHPAKNSGRAVRVGGAQSAAIMCPG